MTATQIPPAAKSTMDAVREGLADIRDRVSDMEALPDLDKLTERSQDLFDRATGRKRRRPTWPLVALGVLAVIGVALGVTMYMMNRGSMQDMGEGADSDMDTPWSAEGGNEPMGNPARTSTAGTFPASDPVQSPMSPSIG